MQLSLIDIATTAREPRRARTRTRRVRRTRPAIESMEDRLALSSASAALLHPAAVGAAAEPIASAPQTASRGHLGAPVVGPAMRPGGDDPPDPPPPPPQLQAVPADTYVALSRQPPLPGQGTIPYVGSYPTLGGTIRGLQLLHIEVPPNGDRILTFWGPAGHVTVPPGHCIDAASVFGTSSPPQPVRFVATVVDDGRPAPDSVLIHIYYTYDQ